MAAINLAAIVACFWSKAAKRGLALMLALTLVVGPARADECKSVEGDFTSVVVPCADPAAIVCTLGKLSGDLKATYEFTMDSIMPGPNGTLLYTGYSVITTKAGTLYSIDTGVMYPAETDAQGRTPFVTTAYITDGTHKYKHVNGGEIVATGRLNFATGEASGTYVGEICK
jgi:hypothetical protein